jgi:hypothetical protein
MPGNNIDLLHPADIVLPVRGQYITIAVMSDDVKKQWRVTTEQGGGFVSWRPDFALPRRWRSTLDAEHLSYGVELEFATRNGTPECWALRLVARDDGEAISASRVRAIRIEECIRVAITAAAMRVERRGDEIVFTPGSRDLTERVELASRPGSDEHLREVAKVYEQASEKPTLAVEQAFGPIAHSTAARWVVEARRRGFLPPTTRGRRSARKES